MNLNTATVTGFFSLPSSELAEHNLTAYNLAMAAAPAGAGTCAHCGTGIRHHVVINTEAGQTAFIGSSCAEKIGGEVARCSKSYLTTAQLAERAVKAVKQTAEFNRVDAELQARIAKRTAFFADAIANLVATGNDFYHSLAQQLKTGSLSANQTRYALKGIFGRRNKANSAEFDRLDYAFQSELGQEGVEAQ